MFLALSLYPFPYIVISFLVQAMFPDIWWAATLLSKFRSNIPHDSVSEFSVTAFQIGHKSLFFIFWLPTWINFLQHICMAT